ncbi:AAA family ATPase [Bradyrhizobium australafricanum]|uniref:AAA family ATPase n=1 Tax=Bradyrhizobium australafricanum TaxID=2821406 RepID=UPI001CE2C00C|nr:AAA family ATPase [Bradyrhizobium australafricanum]MCA6098170.1 AAA family ATPase [Bradyrhizobium australafricanum]
MRPRFDHPALQTLMFGRWDDAFAHLWSVSEKLLSPKRTLALLDAAGDRKGLRKQILATVDELYADGTPPVGALALAWSMLTVDPRQPHMFWPVLPQLQFALDAADLPSDDDAEVRARIRIWWRATEGEWDQSEVSIFRIADVETSRADDEDPVGPILDFEAGVVSTTQSLYADLGLPTLVVMPKSKAAKLKGDHSAYKAILDVALPLVVAKDVAGIRRTLHAEFPHATTAVDLLLRDLREGEPVRMKPVLLVGQPGNSKSRMIRRLGDLLGIGVFRFDGGSSSDGVGYGGTPRGWAESTPCVPARAVLAYKSGNVIAAVDEIDKASANPRNGALFSVLLAHLDRETASRFRDASLDAELDLSWVSHLATANSVDPLPAPLRDRYRIIRVPVPTLQHMPALAASVMRDLAADDEARAGDWPLADDELAVIGKAWQRARFSMRALQKIVGATLEARDQHAMRH